MPDFFIDKDIAKAKTIDTRFYKSEVYLGLSKEKIFIPSWQFIGDEDKVSEPTSVFPFVLLENYLTEPLVLSKTKEGKLHCMSNVCTHRGNLLCYDACKTKQITCKYHGRQFSLDGKFVSMPQFKEVENFPTEDDNLHQLEIFKWGKLLFTSINPTVPAEEVFKDMMNRMSWFGVDKLKYRPDLSKDYKVGASWALYCENYLEGFHIPFVHPELNATLDFGEYTTELFKYSNLQIGIAKKGEAAFDIPSTSVDHGKNVAAFYFWVFPNMMFNFYPWGLSINVVKPIDVSETKVSFYTYVNDESKLDKGAGSGLDKVEYEDEEIVHNVQRGIYSRFYKHGRYSVTHEKGTHHFHSLIAQHIG